MHRLLAGTLFVAVAATTPAEAAEASGYRFFTGSRDPGVPLSGDALRWSPGKWRTGGILEWAISGGPVWTEAWVDDEEEAHEAPFGSLDEVESFVRTAVADWSETPTADMRMEVSGIARELGSVRDG